MYVFGRGGGGGGRGAKARICSTTWTDSKWRPVPSKRDDCLMPNLIGTTFVEPKMKRKFATEYSTAEKWASKS